MSLFGFPQVVAVVAYGWFTYSQLATKVPQNSRWYSRRAPWWGPPGWVFGVAWAVFYAVLTAAIFYFTTLVTPDSWQLITGFVMYVAHVYLNKQWSVAFWDMGNPELALYVLVLGMWPTAIVWLVCMLVDQTGVYLYWVPVMLISIYMLWLLYATALNVYWAGVNLCDEDGEDERQFWRRGHPKKK